MDTGAPATGLKEARTGRKCTREMIKGGGWGSGGKLPKMYWTGPKLEIHVSNVCTVQAQLHIQLTHIHDELLHSNLASHKFLIFIVTIVTK